MLACYIYPIPKGTEYSQEDLKNEDKVIEVFSYCGILEGMITKEGWKFLIDFYGYEKLYEMDKKAIWCDCESIEEYISWITYQIETSPEK